MSLDSSEKSKGLPDNDLTAEHIAAQITPKIINELKARKKLGEDRKNRLIEIRSHWKSDATDSEEIIEYRSAVQAARLEGFYTRDQMESYIADPHIWLPEEILLDSLGWNAESMTTKQKDAFSMVVARGDVETRTNTEGKRSFTYRGEVNSEEDVRTGSADLAETMWDSLFPDDPLNDVDEQNAAV